MIEKRAALRLSPFHPFSERRAQITQMILDGFKQHQIADELHISQDTVKTHINGNKRFDENQTSTDFSIGIKGQIQRCSGKPIDTLTDLAVALIDDVAFFRSEEEIKGRTLHQLNTQEGSILVYRRQETSCNEG